MQRSLCPENLRRLAARHHAGGRIIAFHPLLDAVALADAGTFSPKVEQHDDHRTLVDCRLHHQTAPRFADVAGLAHTDIPRGIFDQRVGVDEPHLAPSPAVHGMRRGSRVLMYQRVVTCCRNHLDQVMRGRNVVAV